MYILIKIIANYGAGLLFHSPSLQHVYDQNEGRLGRQLGFTCDLGVCLGGGREQAVTTKPENEQLQINSLQQQPLSSPAETRSASARNQTTNSFRSEL